MNKYLVKIKSPEYKAGLVAQFEKVGDAESFHNYLPAVE